MTGPLALNETFENLVEITNRPYQNSYQGSYQSTYQNNFQNDYPNTFQYPYQNDFQNSYHDTYDTYETAKTFENTACEDFDKCGKIGGFDYTVNEIRNTFESEGLQVNTRENILFNTIGLMQVICSKPILSTLKLRVKQRWWSKTCAMDRNPDPKERLQEETRCGRLSWTPSYLILNQPQRISSLHSGVSGSVHQTDGRNRDKRMETKCL